jgi:SAM-dependent methyltransferase
MDVALLLWLYERLYHEMAGAYEWVAAGVSLGGWTAWRRAALPHVWGEDLLEIGSGPGRLLADLAAGERRVASVDRSPQMVAEAQKTTVVVRREGRVLLLQGDGRKLSFGAATFDTLLATFPAPYLLEPATLEEACRVLRPGGRLLVMGLWVSPPIWLVGGRAVRMPLPIFYSARPEGLLREVAARLAGVGLRMSVLEERVEWPWVGGRLAATVGGFVAEKGVDPS